MMLKLRGEVLVRSICGEFVGVPCGDTALNVKGMLTLTETGAFLLNALKEACTEEELVEKLMSEYSVEKETARADVHEFLEKLRALNLV